MKIDYEKLLLKYIQHIRDSFGHDLLYSVKNSKKISFTNDELEFLQKLEKSRASWIEVEVSFGEIKIEGITEIKYNELLSLSDLEIKLLAAQEAEDYESCIKLRDKINKLKNENKHH